ncbi:MAG: hypothetical protein ACJ74F_08635 [Mycobacterium sp.]|jgi:hypothetical protein|uniref:hypothetical protein n=1 Tax=Mycobacterium sp. TaxID=1785 RepID=UPI00389AC062
MTGASDQETIKEYEREVTHSRQVMSTAKLVVTFSVAIAATFVAGALQVNDTHASSPTSWDSAAAILMIPAALITVVVIVLPPRHREGKLDPAFANNAKCWARLAYGLMVLQVAFASASSVVAALGLMFPKWA